MLVDTPDYVDRCQHLEKLKDKLEAMLSTQLVTAFNTQSLGEFKIKTIFFRENIGIVKTLVQINQTERKQLLIYYLFTYR